MNRNKYVLLTLVTLICGVMMQRASVVARERKAENSAFGKFSRAEILRKSQPICDALLPGGVLDHLVAFRAVSGDKHGDSKRIWLIDGTTANDEFQVHMAWDADTGKLITASHSVPDPLVSIGHPMGRECAIRVTNSWLTTLGISRTDYWTPANTLWHNKYVWRVEWKAESQSFAVTIDANTGNLIMAQLVCANGSNSRPQIAAASKHSDVIAL